LISQGGVNSWGVIAQSWSPCTDLVDNHRPASRGGSSAMIMSQTCFAQVLTK